MVLFVQPTIIIIIIIVLQCKLLAIMAAGQDYFDIVLFGKTGLGRTSLGSKLVGTDDSKIGGFWSSDPEVKKSDELVSNEETKIRVLDVPGLSGLVAKHQTTEQRNEEVVQWIGSIQKEFQLQIKRMVYFLPVRGPLSKADGSMQEELKLLNHYFGRQAFDCMVVVATQLAKFQQHGFDDEDLEETKNVFHTALKKAVDEDMSCPPIVYIGLNDTSEEALGKICHTPVLNESIVPRIKKIGLFYRNNHSAVGGKRRNDGTVKYHPSLVSRYTSAEKFFGGLAHLALLGLFLLYTYCTGNETWPGFTNAEMICAKCQRAPETAGCTSKTDSD